MDFIDKYKYIFLLPIPITTLPQGEYRKFIYQMFGGVLFLESYNIAFALVTGMISKITDAYNYLTYQHIDHSLDYITNETQIFIGSLKEEFA